MNYSTSPIPLRRDMSYRKPVPDYIPSPPSSPIAETFDSPEVRVYPSDFQRENLPPLPGDWKDFVQQMRLQQEQVNPVVAAEGSKSSNTQSSMRMPTLDIEDKISSSGPFGPTSPSSQKRRLPQTYRPPTPPLPSANPKWKPSVDNKFLPSPRMNNISDDFGFRSYPPGASDTISFPRPTLQIPRISTQSSYRTDKSDYSSATYVAGSGRSLNNSKTEADNDWNDLPVLPMFIVKPPAGRRGLGSSSSPKASSMESSHKSWFDSSRMQFMNVFCCFHAST